MPSLFEQAREKFVSLKKSAREDIVAELEEVLTVLNWCQYLYAFYSALVGARWSVESVDLYLVNFRLLPKWSFSFLFFQSCFVWLTLVLFVLHRRLAVLLTMLLKKILLCWCQWGVRNINSTCLELGINSGWPLCKTLVSHCYCQCSQIFDILLSLVFMVVGRYIQLWWPFLIYFGTGSAKLKVSIWKKSLWSSMSALYSSGFLFLMYYLFLNFFHGLKECRWMHSWILNQKRNTSF